MHKSFDQGLQTAKGKQPRFGNFLHFSDSGYIDDMYRDWIKNPSSVAPQWSAFFQNIQERNTDEVLEGVEFSDSQIQPRQEFSQYPVSREPSEHLLDLSDPEIGAHRLSDSPSNEHSHIDKRSHAYKQSRVNAMIWAYRDVGYLYADLNPLKGYITPDLWYMMFEVEGDYETLSLHEFGLTEEDLDTPFLTGRFIPEETLTLRKIVDRMNKTYCGKLGIEILHIQNKAIRNWLITRLEGPRADKELNREEKINLQKDIIKAEEFEQFIHSNFIGQKRFSLEGAEVLIPVLRFLFNSMVFQGLEEAVLGMAHRGRLNVLANSMARPAVDIFSRFVDNYAPHTYGGSGDVKYHLGFSTEYQCAGSTNSLHIGLVANPSHLEAVDPVVEGKTRGIQRRRKDRHRKRVIPILIHGDSAFSGQGVVAETLNLSQLKGYRTGGTIHIIVNNQIGFTTASRDSRSTFFATDVAKSIPIPIIHVNGDDPESAQKAMNLAFQFRQKFGRDVIIDIICYRRLGHNEADEPSFSHPKMYALIKKHKSVRQLYGNKLAEEGTWSQTDQTEYSKQYILELTEDLKQARSAYKPNMDDAYQGQVWNTFNREYSFTAIKTGVAQKKLEQMAKVLVTIPKDFNPHPKLKRFTTNRQEQFFTEKSIDWAFAESLAFASVLLEGYPIRLSGEDCGRGTFSQRHAVWWDVDSEKPRSHVPLQALDAKQAWFSVYDSPLSEFSVLGFDYGYSLAMPNSLTLWEGQFGDFVNGAQVIIDQFIVAAETKWFRSSGLVMLLPHGYEGQGPEHSSAFLERFLSLCADDNIQVVYPSTPAQYFHVLRRQILQKYRKPLVIMSPKSLLRHKKCLSPVEDLVSGHFKTVIDDSDIDHNKVTTVLLCSGKIYYDLLTERENRQDFTRAIIRLEQIYPFPKDILTSIISQFTSAKNFYWVQEETENRGAWIFVKYREELFLPDRLQYRGRSASPSPATGSHKQHTEELQTLLKEAFD